MKKNTFQSHVIFWYLQFIILVLISSNVNAQELCVNSSSDQIIGEENGFRYELWNQYSKGKACMTLGKGALFSGQWSDVENYLARRGLDYDKTKKHQEIGAFFTTYNCLYRPSEIKTGNSYLSVYGWTIEPLVEYYIIEDWRNWVSYMSPDAKLKGSFEVNGSFYDIYTKTRLDKPSILGITTFQQYFSIRREKRNSGTINISDHFKQWESLGMQMGKLDEVSFVVEGFKSSGSVAFKELDVFIKK
jgi:endo-1,4-beta-xylanase